MWQPLDLCKPGPLVGTSVHTLERVMMCMSVRDPGLQSKAQGRLKQFATSPMHRPLPSPPTAPQSEDEQTPLHARVCGCSSGLAVPVGSWPPPPNPLLAQSYLNSEFSCKDKVGISWIVLSHRTTDPGTV